MIRILLFGAPGSGKGTQGDLIVKQYGYLKISTGDMIREEIKNKSEIGLNAKSILSSGELIPDEIIIDMVRNKLNSGKEISGYIMDGFPRTIPQAKSVTGLKADEEIALHLNVDNDLLEKRLTSRLYCENCGASFNLLTLLPKNEGVCDHCGGKLIKRDDDDLETVRKRIDIYNRETVQVINFYKENGKLHEINASGTVNEIFEKIMGELS